MKKSSIPTLKDRFLFSLVPCFLICSCQGNPPTAEVAVSNAAIANADMSGAEKYAPAEIGIAREKMARANQAMKDGNYDLARHFASEAQADAALAQSKANSEKAQLAADALHHDVNVLQEELDRKNQQEK